MDAPISTHRPRPRVVIVGAGFGGLNTALALADTPVEVTIIDRDNYHGFWPLLYQVATAGLGPDDIAHPIRAIFTGHQNITVRLATVSMVDLDDRRIGLDDGAILEYDFLVLATGSASSDFGIPGVKDHTFALKTLPEAVELRNHILGVFERADAERSGPPEGLLTFVLAGGGPTGVEMAGSIAELIATNLALDFRHLDVTRSRVILVEATDHLLAGFSASSQREALSTLQSKGVEVLLGVKISAVDADKVSLSDGTAIPACTVVWTAGVEASSLASIVPGEKRRNGTIVVEADLTLPGHHEVFAVGDIAAFAYQGAGDLPQLAQVAIQGGRHAAANIRRTLAGRPHRPFRYHNHGIMATIGRRAAVAELPGGLKLKGSAGWVAWLAVHLVFLIGFRNRVVVLVNWAWSYITWDRASRVILDIRPDRPSQLPPPR